MKKTLINTFVVAALSGGACIANANDYTLTGNSVEQKDAIEASFNSKDIIALAHPVGDDQIRVIVQLQDLPMAQFVGVNPAVSEKSDKRNVKVNFNSSSAIEYKNFLLSQQQSMISAIKRSDPNFSADYRYLASFNGFAGVISKDKVDSLSSMPGIKAVFPDVIQHAQMDASLDLVNAMEVWEQLGGREEAGKGIRVAIIDSGIRPENPLFSGDGFDAPDPSTLPSDDYCSVDPDFCNNKLIVARASGVPEGFSVVDEEYPDSPLGFNGHGTHVAGTAVGNYGVTAERGGAVAEISGVAPAAYLMVYKGLYATPANPASSSGSNSMLLSMLEAALLDGADVVNNSWGGGAGGSPVGSPYESVFAAMKDAGIVNVFAAGNDGPGPVTIGCPGCSDDVLTVANTTTNRLFANEVDVPMSGIDPIPALHSGTPLVSEPISASIVFAGEIDSANVEGCSAYESESAFADSIALVSRGSCNFSAKIANAEAAGAEAILIYNQAGRGEAPILMGGLDPEQSIPSLMMPATPGIALADYLLNTEETVTATIGSEVVRTTAHSLADIVAEGSSRGPNGLPTFLKPNIAAPGTRIFSGESPDAPGHVGENFSFKNGTSMASPHVAGAAALIKQMRPNWSLSQIQSALVTSSIRDVLKEDADTPADNFDIGAGRLDIERASTVELTYDKLSLVDANCFLSCDLMITVTNTTDSPIEVSSTLTLDNDNVTATVSPEDAVLAAGQSAEVMVSLDVSAAESERWVLGGINWTDSNAATTDYFIPIAVYPFQSDSEQLLNATASASLAQPDDNVSFSALATNEGITGALQVVGYVDEMFDINPATLSATKGGNQEPVYWDAATRMLRWEGALNTGSFNMEPSTDIADALAGFNITGFFSMANVGGPLTCSSICDDTSIELDLPQPITYLGTEYTSMEISSNGFVSLGRNSGSVSASTVHLLPGLQEPNNVVAPYWIDFDLDGTSATDTGGGEIYAFSLVTGHFVVEWANAQLFEHPDQVFNVQVWFNYETGAINYVYGPMGSPTLEQADLGLVVGAENSTGTVGLTYAAQTSSGTSGVFPAEGDEFKLTASPGESIEISYAGTVLSPSAFMDDTATIDEDTTLSLDVLENDADTAIANVFEMQTLSGNFRAVSPVIIDVPAIDSMSVTISSMPSNGTATVNDSGLVTYVPNANYYGTDTMSYTVMDVNGDMYGEGDVNIEIAGVQDAPVLSVQAPTSVSEGDSITVTATASDADGDNVTISINGVQTQSLTVTAPATGSSSSVSFSVSANDGINTTSQTVSVAVTNKSGGSMGWIALLLLPAIYWRRRTR